MDLFIDANIYLNFYSLSRESIEKLSKILSKIKENTITLYITQQIIDEVYRNREIKIKAMLDEIQCIRRGIPKNLMQQGVPEVKELVDEISKLKDKADKAFKKMEDESLAERLPADNLIKSLFSNSNEIKITSEILSRAKDRFDRGNPPGKNGSYGDAINWECILSTAFNGKLHFITADSDFINILDKKKVKYFLNNEWKKKNVDEIRVYENLSEFINTNFKAIKVPTETVDEEKTTLSVSNSIFQGDSIFGTLSCWLCKDKGYLFKIPCLLCNGTGMANNFGLGIRECWLCKGKGGEYNYCTCEKGQSLKTKHLQMN